MNNIELTQEERAEIIEKYQHEPKYVDLFVTLDLKETLELNGGVD